MANKEYSKEKLLLLYDIFRNEMKPNCADSNMNMDYLKKRIADFMRNVADDTDDLRLLDTDRKTMYKYFDAINNYAYITGLFKEDEYFTGEDNDENQYGSWIKKYHKKFYVRGPLRDELTETEYEAISDAISSSAIVSEEAFSHFKEMCPKSLSKYQQNAVYFRKDFTDEDFSNNISLIKQAINEKKVISFGYGYRIGSTSKKSHNKLFSVSVKTISPIKLDYSDGKYYLYAINTDSQIRNYRCDRIENLKIEKNQKYYDVKNIDKILYERIEGAVNQFATGKEKNFKLTISSNNPKVAAQAFQSFADEVTVKSMINDETKWEQGRIEFLCYVQLSPAFYMRLFNLVTFDIGFDSTDEITLEATIDPQVGDGPEVIEGFSKYCEKLNRFLKKD
ncbi:MAG: WYL domain-containing protein [Clostridia bacterium]|nr:WYL domain-containing protein [Clostridia bacterium]